jgi:hypothetical protein
MGCVQIAERPEANGKIIVYSAGYRERYPVHLIFRKLNQHNQITFS